MSSPDPELVLSSTMASVRSELAEFDRLPALRVVEAVLTRHPEYASGGGKLAVEHVRDELATLPGASDTARGSEAQSESVAQSNVESAHPSESSVDADSFGEPLEPIPMRTIDEWLLAVQENVYRNDPPTRLHGRLVLLGLALIDGLVRDALRFGGFLDELLAETTEFEEVVTLTGWHERLSVDRESSDSETPTAPRFREHAALLDDSPVASADADLLDRKAFAEYLADRIDTLAERESGGRVAYSVHLSGDWGAGKTSVLNLLETELESEPSADDPTRARWSVIQFNAWQHQHVNPPWWALLDYVYRESKDELGWLARFEEWAWRWSRQRVQLLVAGVLMALLLGGLFTVFLREGNVTSLSPELVGALAALVGVMWTVSSAMSKPLVLHSAQAAEGYVQYATNPMATIRRRFEKLVRRIRRDRVAIFIDDIDRCDSAYAVGLLEGIQTLFRGAPVVFVVAGDRHWIDTSFEEVYHAQARNHAVFGKSLGTLFTEKTFHFTAPVPRIGTALQMAFVTAVTETGDGRAAATSDDSRRYLDDIEETSDERVILDVLERSSDLPFEDQRAVRTAAVRRLARPEVATRTEHVLLQFVSLLEPNPRGIKRLVNTYGVNRALATLAHTDLSQTQLALWTILSMRWPDLADALVESPGLVAEGRTQTTVVQTDEGTHRLLDHPDVKAVLEWGDEPLTAATVEQCARIWA